jgi:hypothetical protein
MVPNLTVLSEIRSNDRPSRGQPSIMGSLDPGGAAPTKHAISPPDAQGGALAVIGDFLENSQPAAIAGFAEDRPLATVTKRHDRSSIRLCEAHFH